MLILLIFTDATTDLDIAVAEHLTLSSAIKIASLPYTWLPALMYMTTFGFELAVDANLSAVFFATHASSSFTQLQSGYCESSLSSSPSTETKFSLSPQTLQFSDSSIWLLDQLEDLLEICFTKDSESRERSILLSFLDSYKELCHLEWDL